MIEVKDSKIKGKGLFATTRIRRGQIIFKVDDSHVLTDEEHEALPHEPDHCDYLPDGTVVLLPEPQCRINHSCDPNSYVYSVGRDRYEVAMRDIPAGDEITCDYAIDGISDYVLDCHCGSSVCRGTHKLDFFAIPEERQLEYLPYLSLWFAQSQWDKLSALLAKHCPGETTDRA